MTCPRYRPLVSSAVLQFIAIIIATLFGVFTGAIVVHWLQGFPLF